MTDTLESRARTEAEKEVAEATNYFASVGLRAWDDPRKREAWIDDLAYKFETFAVSEVERKRQNFAATLQARADELERKLARGANAVLRAKLNDRLKECRRMAEIVRALKEEPAP